MSARVTHEVLEQYLDLARGGYRQQAVRLVTGLADTGVPTPTIITELLVPAQAVTGERWQTGRWTVADEHLVTGVSQAALEALSHGESPQQKGRVVSVCAESDWHALPSQMFAELLRGHGYDVEFLGASVPADDVGAYLARRRPDALAVTCNLALSYPGVARLVDAAHRHSVPVLAGGAALTAARAERLGADGWAADAAGADQLLTDWRHRSPTIDTRPVALDTAALSLESRAAEIADQCMAALHARLPDMAGYDARQLEHTHDDLAYIVRFAAAARLVDDPQVFGDFLAWLDPLLASRGVPPAALRAGLDVVAEVAEPLDAEAAQLIAAASAPVA